LQCITSHCPFTLHLYKMYNSKGTTQRRPRPHHLMHITVEFSSKSAVLYTVFWRSITLRDGHQGTEFASVYRSTRLGPFHPHGISTTFAHRAPSRAIESDPGPTVRLSTSPRKREPGGGAVLRDGIPPLYIITREKGWDLFLLKKPRMHA